MTRAKDISKIITDADFSGTLDVAGTVTAGVLDVTQGTSPSYFRHGTGTYLNITTGAANGTVDFKFDASSGAYPDATFYTGNSERMRINSSGNVGIGTTSPSAKLEVSGASNSTATFIKPQGALPDNNDNAGLYVLHQGTAGTGLRVRTDNALTGSNFAHILVNNASASINAFQVSQYGSGYIADFNKSGTTCMRVNNNGNVGIGTDSPTIDSSLAGLSVNASGTVAHVNNINGATLKLTDPATGLNRGLGITLQGTEAAISNCESGSLRFGTGNTERMRIDSSGKVGIGTASPTQKLSIADAAPIVEVKSTGTNFNGLEFKNSNGSFYIGQDNSAGTFYGAANARILYSTGAYPIAFFTNGANERMRITSAGYAKHTNFGTYRGSTGEYHEFNSNDAGDATLVTQNINGSFTGDIYAAVAHRSASSAYRFLRCFSGNASDVEAFIAGDGNAYADGSWNGGGADYAEYFEWADGNTDNEDRRGYTVVLDNNKIRKATSDDNASVIIGVISGNPSMVGDSDVEQWKHKYQRDDYGTYIFDDNDERVLNTEYDENQEYVSRRNRQEWDTVGLMGKLRIRKNQPTGSNWIKMRDVSETVEEWLVR